MKMKKLLTLLVAGVMVFSLAACGNKDKDEPADNEVKEESQQEEKDKAAANDSTDEEADTEDSTETPEFTDLTVDADNKEISFEAVVNGTYFTEATRHAVSWEGGGNGEKSIFRAVPYNVDFYDALESLGAKGGDSVSMDDMSASVEDNVTNTGDKLEFYVKWDGQDEVLLKDVIKASEDFDWDVVFAGNRGAAEDTQAGCILCLDSCAAGITTNAALPVGSTGDDGIDFFGNDEVLPEDGTTVTIIVRVVE